VYVMPPGRDMVIAGGALHLRPRAVHSHHHRDGGRAPRQPPAPIPVSGGDID
jgi:hypothetical protein